MKTLTVDTAGRIVLPKPMRDELQLQPGDSLEIEVTGDEIKLRPIRGNFSLHKKQGVWVFRSGTPLSDATVEKTRQGIRNERNEAYFGKPR